MNLAQLPMHPMRSLAHGASLVVFLWVLLNFFAFCLDPTLQHVIKKIYFTYRANDRSLQEKITQFDFWYID